MEKKKLNVEKFDENILKGEATIVAPSGQDMEKIANEAVKEIQESLPDYLSQFTAKVDNETIHESFGKSPTEKKVSFSYELFSEGTHNVKSKSNAQENINDKEV